MTAPGAEVIIRPPAPIRLLVFAFVLGGGGLIVSWGLDDVRDGGFPWHLVLFAVAWIGIGLRTALVEARTSGERLKVRNQMSTHTFERSEIEDVRVVRAAFWQQNQGGLQLLLTDGGAMNVQAAAASPFGQRRSQEARHRLLDWLGRPG